jgi:ABC-2 type transport system ATP-binding protein
MLKINDLVKVYSGNPPVTALYGVSLEIDRGMFGLLGPNGAGKSTLMRILAGVLEATSGSATFQAGSLDNNPPMDILHNPDRIWPILGFLPQEFGFYPHLTGAQMLDFLLTMKGVEAPGKSRRVLVSELLERVNLSQAARQPVRGYSGGMKQRLAIAQALAGDPKLLIVDEPTAGLDPEERHRFYRLLAELAADRTVVLSTHIVEDVATLCRRFAIVKAGRIVAQTTPGAARAAIEGTIFEGDADIEEFSALRERYCVTQAALIEGINRVRIFSSNGQFPEGFLPVTPTLEDAYLAVMRGGLELFPDGSPLKTADPIVDNPSTDEVPMAEAATELDLFDLAGPDDPR